MTDIVITYVDGQDPVWQEDYSRYAGRPLNVKRYRDWGTLRYLLRGISRHMPFVGDIYLVVHSESQVPEWVASGGETDGSTGRGKLHIVLHRDLIPHEYLPTFNSTTIEMFLPRIEGLREQFIYFNDDIFPLMDCSEDDFFRDGGDGMKAACHMHRHLLATNMYKKQVRNSSREAARAAFGHVQKTPAFIRPQHICTPMLRSQCLEAFGKSEEAILPVLSRLRTPHNICQYFFTDYTYFVGKTFNRRISGRHFSLAAASAESVCRFIAAPTHTFACINDVNMSHETFISTRERLLEAFEAHFPDKSPFEK